MGYLKQAAPNTLQPQTKTYRRYAYTITLSTTNIYRRFRGSEHLLMAPKPGNRFRFRFVFVSCVRASGRGEAAWAREGSASSPLGLRGEKRPTPPRGVVEHMLLPNVWVLSLFGPEFYSRCSDSSVICVGFKGLWKVLIAFVLLYVRVLRGFLWTMCD